MIRPLGHTDIAHLSPEAWRDRLFASVDTREQGGSLYPAFPDGGVQRQFVGSEGRAALGEAYRFYDFTLMHGLTRPRVAGGYLDFGCGWGRIGRFFLRDFPEVAMASVDIDPGMVGWCREAGLPGRFETIRNGEPLPFADGSVALATAYSVFTHLSPPLFEVWLSELLRVLAPGGKLILTVEPPRFLDWVAQSEPDGPDAWHASFAPWKPDLPRLRRELAERGITFIPTGGGAYREADIYGETVVTAEHLAWLLGGRGRLELLYDEPDHFWQAVAVITRRDSRRIRLKRALGLG